MFLRQLLNDSLSWHDRHRWDEALSLLDRLFAANSSMLLGVQEKALLVQAGIDAVDPFLQLNTAEVCPGCRKICCANRHAYYDHEDLIYALALGHRPPRYREGLEDAAPCQFIAAGGCTVPRSLRPFRCNWYFCDALLRHMEEGPAKPCRSFIRSFHHTVTLRGAMIDEFFSVLSPELPA